MAEYYGSKVRAATESERKFFRSSPHVSGYAAPDDAIVLNPFSSLSAKEKESVARNEGLRIALRKNPDVQPRFELTPGQKDAFAKYSDDPQDIRNTILARIITGDPSAGATPEQTAEAALLHESILKKTKGTNGHSDPEREKTGPSSRFNTKLPPTEEAAYIQFARKTGMADHDYDLRGAYSEGIMPDERMHMPDKYKKPNAPTFSNESIYSDGSAGDWTKDRNGDWVFTAGPANFKGQTPMDLLNYWKHAEPDAQLIMPPEAVALMKAPGSEPVERGFELNNPLLPQREPRPQPEAGDDYTKLLGVMATLLMNNAVAGGGGN